MAMAPQIIGPLHIVCCRGSYTRICTNCVLKTNNPSFAIFARVFEKKCLPLYLLIISSISIDLPSPIAPTSRGLLRYFPYLKKSQQQQHQRQRQTIFAIKIVAKMGRKNC